MDNYTLDTAARFGEIPFVEFTKELVTGVFDCLLEAHLEQMEAFSAFLNSLTQDLTTYINNTVDNVNFSDVSQFLLNYELPKLTDTELSSVLNTFKSNAASTTASPTTTTASGNPDKWWQGLMNTLGPAVANLTNKVKDSNLQPQLNALAGYNTAVASTIPNYKQIYDSVAALMCSNKYSLLQNMAKMGMMRLVVTEGEIETKITFSTWNNSSSGSSESDSLKQKVITKNKVGGGLFGLITAKKKNKTRTVTVNSAQSYQRDSSGSRVDIFGHVIIRFKSDYAPLNG